MAELIAKSPLAGFAPVVTPSGSLTEVHPGQITSLQPHPGKLAALSKALKKAHGVGFPGPGESLSAKGVTVIWSGREQAFQLGVSADPALADLAAVTDQSDGWAVMLLQGPKGAQVLARLCPLDLRPGVFAVGQVARSQLQHVPALIHRSKDGFQIMVFRSMARTAWHELATALHMLAARDGS